MSDAIILCCTTRASVLRNIRNGRGARFWHYRGFTLIELLVVIAIISVLAAILFPVFASAQQSGRRARCAQQIKQIIQANLAYADDNSGHFVLAASDISGVNLHRWHGVRKNSSQDFDPTKGPLWTYLGKSGGIKMCPSLQMLKGKAVEMAAYESGCGGYGYNYLYVGGTYYRNSQTKAQKISSTSSDLARPTQTIMFTDAAMVLMGDAGNVLIEESFAYPPYLVSTNASGSMSATEASPSVHFRHGGRASVGWCDGHVTCETMSCTLEHENAYGVASKPYNLGWFGPKDNSLWDNR